MGDLTPGAGPLMEFELGADADGTPIVRVTGELDIATVERLDAAVEPVLQTEPGKLIVDADGLEFADSSAIATMVRWSIRLGEIEVRGAPPLLRRVITRMGLEQTLRLT